MDSQVKQPECANESSAQGLPYVASNAVGAADFYFTINATFRFIFNRPGQAGLRRYWTRLGEEYMAPVWRSWQRGGLPAIASYWRAFFAAEPGAQVEVVEAGDHVTLEVQRCPAIAHLREHGREILPCFCQHCYFVSEAAAQRAGFTMRVSGGNGSCRQVFYPASAQVAEQRLSDIEEASGHAGGV